MLTREQGKNALTHIVSTVFQLRVDSLLSRALDKDGVIVADDFLTLSDNEIESLTYDDEQGTETTLPRSFKMLLRIFQRYYDHLDNKGEPIGDSWTSIMAQEFGAYRISPAGRGQATTPSSTTLTTPTSARASFYDPISTFKKGIK
jgi:hypothetical protein